MTISFSAPPVIEVVCGVAFDGIEWTFLDFGRFAERLPAGYRYVGVKPPLPMPAQDETATQGFELSYEPVPPRVWFETEDGELLLQLQSDRLALNWRKREGKPYPTFLGEAGLLRRFLDAWAALESYVADRRLGAIEVKYFELSYINHLHQGDVWNTVDDLGKLFPAFGPIGAMRPRALRIDLGLTSGDLPVNVSIKPQVRVSDGRKLYWMEIGAREFVDGETAPEQWFRRANEQLPTVFKDLISADARKQWGYVDA